MVLYQCFLTLLLLVFLKKQHVQCSEISTEICEDYIYALDCSNQELTSIPPDLFSSTHEKIALGGNPFVCDCSILWFMEIIKSDSGERNRIVDLDNVTCDTPERLRFEKISELNQDDICPSSTTTEPTTGYKTDYTPTSADPCESDYEETPKCDVLTEICVPIDDRYICDCKKGFERNHATDQCEVVDACHGQNNCSKHAYCINKIGSYKCICNPGYVGNGIDCEDFNECEKKGSNECHKYALCINEEGGYRCRCRSGFEQHKEGRVCIRKSDVSPKTVALAALIAGVPLLIFVAISVYLCKRYFRKKMLARQDAFSPENPPTDDVMTPENQQLIPAAGSFYDECIPMKGLPPSESAWSEWPDYDDRGESDSD